MKVMKLVFSLPDCGNQSRPLQHFNVLTYGLSSQSELMFHRQPATQLEQGLAVSINQFVQNRAARRCCDRLKDIAHARIIGKSPLACQERRIDLGGQLVAERGVVATRR